METDNMILDAEVHHGHNIKRTRRKKGIKQEDMASKVNLSQQTVSRYESMEVIDDDMLARFATALDVPMEYLKYREQGALSVTFENNKFDNNDKATGIGAGDDNSTNHFNPMEKIVELYERLLDEEKKRNDLLEKRLTELEKKTGK